MAVTVKIHLVNIASLKKNCLFSSEISKSNGLLRKGVLFLHLCYRDDVISYVQLFVLILSDIGKCV